MFPDPQQRRFNKDIAALRGVAILLVLGYHLFPGKLPWGFVGVDVFFVISGYLIAQILGDSNTWQEVKGFYINRARRIYPALLVVLASGLLAGFVFLLDDEYEILLKSTIFSLFQLQNFHEMSRSGYFVDAVNFRPLLHLWSLGVEFQFYLAFPLLLIVGRRLGLSAGRVTSLLVAVSLLLCVFLPVEEPADKFFLPVTRFWELGLGAACYLLMARGWQPRGGVRWLVLGLSLLCWLGVALVVRSDANYPGYLALLPTAAVFSFLIARPLSDFDTRVLRPLFFVAAISYSLYLWHYPLIEFMRQAYGPLTIPQRLFILAASFAAASLTDLYLVPRILAIRKSTAVLSAGAAGFVTVSFLLVLSTQAIHRPIEARNAALLKNINFEVDYKFSCEFLTGASHKQDRCRTGLESAAHAQYTIIGDSQANSLTTVFDALSLGAPQFSHYVQIGRGLCPMVPGVGDAACQSLASMALDFAAQEASPRVIFVAGQWPLYISKNATETDVSGFLRGLEVMLEKFTAAGKQVVFVHSVPLGALPRTCVSRLPESSMGSCDTPLATVNLRQEGYKERIDPLLKRFKVIEFDPARYLCDDEKCAVFNRSEILYLDDSHLSRSGGNFIAQKSRGWFAENLVTDLP